jgi:hypothetical protein
MSGRLRQRQAYLLQDLPTDNRRSPHSNPSRHTGVQQLRVIATGVRVNCSVEYILSTSGGWSKTGVSMHLMGTEAWSGGVTTVFWLGFLRLCRVG